MVGGDEGSTTAQYLSQIGVRSTPRATCPFDPGYDPATLEGHIQQSGHLMATLKISMACWMVADEGATRRKIRSATQVGIPAVAGGGPFETAVAQRALPSYLDLCADVGLTRIECGEGFTELNLRPEDIVRQASARGLEVEFELGEKHAGRFTDKQTDELIATGKRWLQAGAVRLVVEARESAEDVGLFSAPGEFDTRQADRLAEAFGLGAAAVRGAEQGQPVRADRSLRPGGAAGQRTAGGGAASRDLPARASLRRFRSRQATTAASG